MHDKRVCAHIRRSKRRAHGEKIHENQWHALTFTSNNGGGRQFGFPIDARIFIIFPWEH